MTITPTMVLIQNATNSMLDILRNRENNGIDYTGRAGIDDVTPSRGVD